MGDHNYRSAPNITKPTPHTHPRTCPLFDQKYAVHIAHIMRIRSQCQAMPYSIFPSSQHIEQHVLSVTFHVLRECTCAPCIYRSITNVRREATGTCTSMGGRRESLDYIRLQAAEHKVMHSDVSAYIRPPECPGRVISIRRML